MNRRALSLFVILPLCLVGLLTSCKKPANTKLEGVPPHIQDLVFKRSEFAAPITLGLQFQDNREFMNTIRASTTMLTVAPRLGGWPNTPASIVWMLEKAQMATVEEAVQTSATETRRYRFLFYNDTLKPFIVKAPSTQSPFEGNAMFGGNFEIRIAARKLKSIDYTNAYEDAGRSGGAKIKYHALTFSYTVQPSFPGLPNVSNVFTGKAKAYLDPDDGAWKLDHCNLNDAGTRIFTDWLDEQYSSVRLAELSAKVKSALEQQQWEEAKESAYESLRLRKGDSQMQASLEKAEAMLHKKSELIVLKDRLNRTRKDVARLGMPQDHDELAWQLGTAPFEEIWNGIEAVDYGLKAAAYSKFANPGTLGTLAAAYARNGNFKKAIETQKNVILCLKANGERDDSTALAKSRAQLNLYEHELPYKQGDEKLTLEQVAADFQATAAYKKNIEERASVAAKDSGAAVPPAAAPPPPNPVPTPPKPDVASVEPKKPGRLLQDMAGVQFTAFKVDENDNPTPDNTWIGAQNSTNNAMILNGEVVYSIVEEVNGKRETVIHKERIQEGIKAGTGKIVWKRRGDEIKILEIVNLDVFQGAEAVMTKEKDGIKLTVFKMDENSKPTPNAALMFADNANKEKKTISGNIVYRATTSGDEKTALVYSSKFSVEIKASGNGLIWKREGINIEVMEIKDLAVDDRVVPQSKDEKEEPRVKADQTGVMLGEQFAQTRLRPLGMEEIEKLSAEQLRYAINEMYARHGADFKDPQIKNLFTKFAWYQPGKNRSYDDAELTFSETESKNVKILGQRRDELKNKPVTVIAANMKPACIGIWRYENGVGTFAANGTSHYEFNNRQTARSTWSINADVLTEVTIERNGRRQANEIARYRISSLTTTQLIMKDLRSGKEWRATRIK